MIPFDLGLKLKQPVPHFAPSAKREVKESEHIPYTAHYDANTLLTRNEDLIQVIKIEGLPFETSSDNYLRLRKRFRNNLLRTLAKSQYALYVHTVRRKQHVYPDGRFPNGFAGDLNQAWKARHQNLELYVNDIYVSIVRKPRMSGVAGLKGFVDTLIGKRFDRERELALRVAAKDLEELTARMMTSLSEYRPQLLGFVETPRGLFSELLRFVGLLVNCEDRPMRVPKMDLSRYLPCNRLIFGRDAFEARGINKRYVGAVLSIKEYESSTEYGVLDDFLTVPVEMIITQSFVFIDRPKAKEAMEMQQRRMEQVEDRSISQIEEIDEALDDITAGRLAEGLHHLTVTIRAADMPELDRALALVTDAFVNIGVVAVREDLNMELCYWAQLPGNFPYITRGAMISSMNFAAFASMHNYNCGSPYDNHWGSAISVLESRSGTPYYFNWHVAQVGHTLFGAPTGVGKSTLMNFLIAQSVKVDPMVIYFDKDHGAEIFIRAMRGVHSTISLGKKTGFNPLQLPDTPENRDFLNQWFALLLTAFGESLSAEDIAVIKQAVEGNYSLDIDDRKLGHVAEFFGLKSPGRLGGRLTNWYGEGRYAALFDNDEDVLGFSKRLYGFEMGHIIDDDIACAPIVAYLFHRIEMVLDGQPVIIVLEEGAKLIRNPYFPPMLDDWLTTLRKRNGMVVFVTPDLAAAYKYGSDNLVKQTATKIFLANDKADRASYVDQFSLSDGEFEIIRTLNPSERVFLIKHGKDSVLAKLDLSGLQQFIPILSGTTTNVQILHGLMEELHSDDPDVWLPPFLERTAS